MSWMGNGLLTKKNGESLDVQIPSGGFFLSVAGRQVNSDGSLGGYFSHRRPTRFWYAEESEAMAALLNLASQEEVAKHPVKPEIDLKKPGVVEASAWVEPHRW